MQKTVVPDVWMWSRWQPDRNLNFNSWFVEGDGNTVIDPLEPDAEDLAQFEAMGGVAWVILTNRDHERAAKTFVGKFGSRIAASEHDTAELNVAVDEKLKDNQVFRGWRTIALEGFKSRGEIALHSASRKTAILGDSLWGDPAGSLRFMPAEKLSDPARAMLSIRRVRAVRDFDHLLTGDGTPIYGNARSVFSACIDGGGSPATFVVNLDEVPLVHRRAVRQYGAADGEIGLLIGARKLGYRIAHIEPGHTFCPVHWHTGDEEMFLVWAGEPTVRMPSGDVKLRKGDCIAFTCTAEGAHSIRNDGTATASVFMLSNNEDLDVCFYPNSKKVLVRQADILVRTEPDLDYFDGE